MISTRKTLGAVLVCLMLNMFSVEPMVWHNNDFGLYDAKKRCEIRKISTETSGVEVIFRPTIRRPGLESYFMLAAITDYKRIFVKHLASYGALAMEVENCNSRPLVFRVRIVTHRGNSERGTDNFERIIPANSKVAVKVPYTTIAPFSKIKLDSRLRRAPSGTDAGENLFSERMSVDFCVISASIYQEKEYLFRITNIRFIDDPPKYNPILADEKHFFPFIDDFGQYIHEEWPSKVKDKTELIERDRKESAELDATPPIANRSRFGGWADGPVMKATGFFRIDKYKGLPTLVDPDGKIFFAMGINGISFKKNDYKKKRSHWFTHLNDHTYSNLSVKYGKEIDKKAVSMVQKRLTKWGINTVGGWVDKRIYLTKSLAYTPVLLDWSKEAKIPGRKFYDAFDPLFEQTLDKTFQTQWRFSLKDPWCIGYFIHNELDLNPMLLAEHVAAAPADMPGKKEFMKFLKNKYPQISDLNKAWSSKYSDYNDFLSTRKPCFDNRKSHHDMTEFGKIMIDRYYKVCSDAVRRNAPDHLYLGSRIMPVPSADIDVAYILNKYCDVVSINSYHLLYRDLTFPGITKPIWLSEYSIRADGHGYFGVQQCAGQKERAAMFRSIFHDILANPQIIGASWFSYKDQIVTGRDIKGEGYPFGFVDITDTPYREMTAESRILSEKMYDLRFNQKLERKWSFYEKCSRKHQEDNGKNL